MKFLIRVIIIVVTFFLSLFPTMAQTFTTTTTTTTSTVNGKDTTVVTQTVVTTTNDPLLAFGKAVQSVMPDSAAMAQIMKQVVVIGDTVAQNVKRATVKGAQQAKTALENAKLTQAEADSIRSVLSAAAEKIDDWLKSVTEQQK